jgi:hypothetical protein
MADTSITSQSKKNKEGTLSYEAMDKEKLLPRF